MALKIGVIVSTTRPSRVGRGIADWFLEQVKDIPQIEFELLDLAEINLPLVDEPKSAMMGQYQNEHTKKWSQTIAPLDGYVWVTAEYNHGYPAPLKNAIDTLYHEWSRKPVAFVGYGGLGAARAIEQLVQVAAQVNMVAIPSTTVQVIDVWSALDENGAPKPEFVRGDSKKMLEQLTWWANALKIAREQSV